MRLKKIRFQTINQNKRLKTFLQCIYINVKSLYSIMCMNAKTKLKILTTQICIVNVILLFLLDNVA